VSKPGSVLVGEHEHEWALINEEPITRSGKGYVWGWGSDATVIYQTGVRRRFYCTRCREPAEDVEMFEREKRLTP
jgi:hypothetical protein